MVDVAAQWLLWESQAARRSEAESDSAAAAAAAFIKTLRVSMQLFIYLL